MCILFIDKDISYCKKYAEFCDKYDYSYKIINDFNNVDSEIINNSISLICIDNNNNTDIIHEIKKNHPDIIILIITESEYIDILISLINSNDIFKYILKPFDENVMRSHINQSLSFLKELDREKKLIKDLREKNIHLNKLRQKIEKNIYTTNTCLKTSGNILMNFPCSIIIHNEDNQIIYFNNKASETFDIDDNYLGKEISKIFAEELFSSFSSLSEDSLTLEVKETNYNLNYLFSKINPKYGLLILLEVDSDEK